MNADPKVWAPPQDCVDDDDVVLQFVEKKGELGNIVAPMNSTPATTHEEGNDPRGGHAEHHVGAHNTMSTCMCLPGGWGSACRTPTCAAAT